MTDRDSERPPAAPSPTGPVETTNPRGLLVGLVLGLPLIIAGSVGAVTDADDTHPGELARWIVGLAAVHDLLIVPLVLAAGWALHHLVRDVVIRRIVEAALLATAALSLIAYPLIRGYGRSPSVPSALNRNYGLGLVAYLAVIWAVTGVVCAAHLVRARRADRRHPRGASTD